MHHFFEKGKRIAVIGAGSWGTTLANLLAEKEEAVHLWVFEEDLLQSMMKKRENEMFLPGVPLSDRILFTHSLEEAVRHKEILVCAVPSHVVREVFTRARSFVRAGSLIITATKGLEDQTCKTMSDVLGEVLASVSGTEIACLSGPSFAREVSKRIPAAVAAAGTSPRAAEKVQDLFSRSYFRIYTNPDLLGIQLGGATKNVMAIAAGTSDGLGFGHSSRAALITRGLAEMTRLGVKMGAKPGTFSGLAGLGDLVLTCAGDLSRNRQVGLEIGRGRPLASILEGMKMVAEGVRTTKVLRDLAGRLAVEMPITEKVYEVLYEGKDPRAAVGELMSREKKSEQEEF
jgi:glycerol-3-phosphate dehydrogenase (NAD(P)+)